MLLDRNSFLRARDLVDVVENPERIVGTSHCLLVEMVNDIFHYLRHSLRRGHCLFPVNGRNLFVSDTCLLLHGIDIIDSEREYVAVIDGINDGVCVEFVSEGLLRGFQPHVSSGSGILCEDRRARETEHVIFLEVLRDGGMHLSEVASVTFIEDNYHALLEYGVVLVLLDEDGKLLYGRDNDTVIMMSAVLVLVLQLSLQYGSRGVAVRCALLETVIFLHRLIVQIFSVDDEEDFVNVRESGCQLCCLE